MKDEILLNIIKWYYIQFGKNWKLSNCFEIDTLDNPGWSLTIGLEGTILFNKKFEISIDHSENDWIRCYVENENFEAAGGVLNLSDILEGFTSFLKNYENSCYISEIDIKPCNFFCESKIINDDNLMWLVKWYSSQCNGDWEHSYGVLIKSFNHGWYVKIDIFETELHDLKFNEVIIDRSENNWINCFVKNKQFIGLSSPFNLIEIIQIFCDWAKKHSEQ